MPTASQPWLCAASATARITAFRPGASPPPVLIPMRRIGPRRRARRLLRHPASPLLGGQYSRGRRYRIARLSNARVPTASEQREPADKPAGQQRQRHVRALGCHGEAHRLAHEGERVEQEQVLERPDRLELRPRVVGAAEQHHRAEHDGEQQPRETRLDPRPEREAEGRREQAGDRHERQQQPPGGLDVADPGPVHQQDHRRAGQQARGGRVDRTRDDASRGDAEDADRRQQSLVQLAAAREVLHERQQHALDARHQDRDRHQPRHHHGPEAGRHQAEPRQDVAEDEDHEHGLRERREQQERGVARGDHQVAAQQREEGRHSRSPRPVRWMYTSSRLGCARLMCRRSAPPSRTLASTRSSRPSPGSTKSRRRSRPSPSLDSDRLDVEDARDLAQSRRERLRRAHPQVEHLRPGQRALERRRRVERQDAAVVDDRQALAEPVRLLHVVRREDEGDAALVQAAQRLPQQAPRLGIEAGGGLVEQHHLRVVHQRARDQHALLLAAGERERLGLGLVGHLQLLEQPRGALLALVGGQAEVAAVVGEHLPHASGRGRGCAPAARPRSGASPREAPWPPSHRPP